MAFAMVVFWGLIATAIVLVIRSHGRGNQEAPDPALPVAALRVLDERFARGEIDADEYSRRRRLLTAE